MFNNIHYRNTSLIDLNNILKIYYTAFPIKKHMHNIIICTPIQKEQDKTNQAIKTKFITKLKLGVMTKNYFQYKMILCFCSEFYLIIEVYFKK
ncbi:hypothetical protein BTO01_29160 [Vibrio jasicida]|nr:hypothetical protein BTO01_29160 [Vibrio jasicida]